MTDTLAQVDSALAALAAQIVRYGKLSRFTPEQQGRIVDNPRLGDLAVIAYRDAPRFAVVTHILPKQVRVSHILPASIRKASIRAEMVTWTDMDPRSPGYAERLGGRAVDALPDGGDVKQATAAYRDAHRAASLDAITAQACANAGLPWYTCWANVTIPRIPRAELRVIRDPEGTP